MSMENKNYITGRPESEALESDEQCADCALCFDRAELKRWVGFLVCPICWDKRVERHDREIWAEMFGEGK